MITFLAALPLLVAIGTLAARVPPPRAAALAVATALVVAWLRFPITQQQASRAVGSVSNTVIEVMLVLFGGVLLAQVMNQTGANERIAGWIERCAAGKADAAALLMVLGITPFAESVTGFGMGAVIAVPLLRHLGFTPTRSVLLGLLGLGLTAWGALSPGALVASTLGEVDPHALGVRSALMAGVVVLGMGVTALLVVRGRRWSWQDVAELLLVGGALWGGLLVSSALLGPFIGGAIGGLCAVLVSLAGFRFVKKAPLAMDAETRRALLPYGVLIGGLLLSTLIIQGFGFTGPITILRRGSVWLLTSCMVAFLLFRVAGTEMRLILSGAVKRWWPIGAATGLFLILGTCLSATGMSSEVARGLQNLGPAYVFLSPFVAGLGGFVGGSNAAANAMFAAAQGHAATGLGVSRLQLVSTQHVVSGLLTTAAPTRVALAQTMAGSDGVDSVRVYRTLLGLGALVMAATGALNLMLV